MSNEELSQWLQWEKNTTLGINDKIVDGVEIMNAFTLVDNICYPFDIYNPKLDKFDEKEKFLVLMALTYYISYIICATESLKVQFNGCITSNVDLIVIQSFNEIVRIYRASFSEIESIFDGKFKDIYNNAVERYQATIHTGTMSVTYQTPFI